MVLLDHADVFVTQAEIEGKIFGYTPVVLQEACFRPIVDVTGWVSDEHTADSHVTGKEIFQGRRRGEGTAAEEFKTSPASGVGASGEAVPMKLAAKLQRMLAARIGNVVHELPSGVRPLHFGPYKSAQYFRHVERQNGDDGQASIQGISYSCIDAIGRR